MGIIGIQAERYRYNDFKGIDIGIQTVFQPDIPAHLKVIQHVRFQDCPDSRIHRRCCHIEQFSDFPCRHPYIVTRYWYMVQSITNHWTTRYLQEAIKLDDYGKHGALANNFTETLPVPEANDVKSMLKDPYIFDMLTFTEQYNERDVEIGLVKQVEKFLIEMGAGFAFMGRQYHIEVSGDDYYIDILMYNAFLHRYLVIELKNTEFMPEYIGKLNFYCSAVDDILCREGDNRTIGLLLCKSKDRIKAEYALRDIQKPIGISDYELGQALPKDFRGSLPTIEEIEKELESDR